MAEYAGNGTLVGLLTATDPDAGDALTFALVDDARSNDETCPEFPVAV